MNRNIIIASFLGIILAVSACNSGGVRRNPGRTYAPDMTYSVAYDAYTVRPELGKDSIVSRLPVKGTVARGKALPNHLTNMDTAAYSALTNLYTFSEKDLDHGRRMYNIYCGVCHGESMKGDGPLYTSGKFAAMPANLTDAKYTVFSPGRIYFAIMYGKNMMGPYDAQLNDKERWQVIAYIKSKTGTSTETVETAPAADSTATASN